jgi:hypothetical protein
LLRKEAEELAVQAELNAKLQAVEKYTKMIHVKVPLQGVLQQMKRDNIQDALMMWFTRRHNDAGDQATAHLLATVGIKYETAEDIAAAGTISNQTGNGNTTPRGAGGAGAGAGAGGGGTDGNGNPLHSPAPPGTSTRQQRRGSLAVEGFHSIHTLQEGLVNQSPAQPSLPG